MSDLLLRILDGAFLTHGWEHDQQALEEEGMTILHRAVPLPEGEISRFTSDAQEHPQGIKISGGPFFSKMNSALETTFNDYLTELGVSSDAVAFFLSGNTLNITVEETELDKIRSGILNRQKDTRPGRSR